MPKYRWLDAPPAAALRVKKRREWRNSQLYARVKAGRAERFDLEASPARPAQSANAPQERSADVS